MAVGCRSESQIRTSSSAFHGCLCLTEVISAPEGYDLKSGLTTIVDHNNPATTIQIGSDCSNG
jgi:hypothetical protein